ncbi:hypothetical protein LTR86_006088 [Recurvomyces mirabilis]|nr:hypothetical protein LTR86_006088 [Recurvomyces mirabilis]
MSNQIRPYKVAVTEEAINTLRSKLQAATLPGEVEFSDDWDQGTPRSEIARLAKYWGDGFDWRAQEAEINRLPQFMTTVELDGFGQIDMHFVHQKSEKEGSIPLLFSHGWPGSFLEVDKIIPLLTRDADGPPFDVVAPSLPNFGFSGGSRRRGFGIAQYAEAMHKVMLSLGYNKYVTQGGDWGFKVTRFMGIQYPNHCLASHLNMILANEPDMLKHPKEYAQYNSVQQTATEKQFAERTAWFMQEGLGYNILQSTKPSTIGFALADSPVALLAWIYEKLHDWTDNYPWTDDEILTWVSIYQFSTAGPAASARIYYDIQNSAARPFSDQVLEYNDKVLLGLSYFPKDIHLPPLAWGRTLGPVVFEGLHESGGHFAAHERPDQLVKDLRAMFGAQGGAASVAALFAGTKG